MRGTPPRQFGGTYPLLNILAESGVFVIDNFQRRSFHMKRNLDLVRSILLLVEEAESYLEIIDLFKARDRIKGCEFSNSEIIYHVELLIAHGFIDGKLRRDMNGDVMDGCIDGLTWDRDDFRSRSLMLEEALGDLLKSCSNWRVNETKRSAQCK